jgi:hypothetical protein
VVPSEEGQNTGVPHKPSIHVLTRDILRYLQEKGYKNPIAEQTVSSSMQKHVVLEKNKCEGLNEDIKWKKAQIKRDHGNLRGYRIDFESESKRRAFERIKKMKDERPF